MTEKTEGVYRWSITSLPGGTVETDHYREFIVDPDGYINYSEWSSREGGILLIENVNSFGPDDKPWRWVEKRRK
jgi:hypothetical protein